MTEDADHLLDASGLYCPEPVMLLHNALQDIAVGATLKVLATDPSTTRDIPKFCTFLGHELLQEGREGGEGQHERHEVDGPDTAHRAPRYVYILRKGSGT